MSVDVFTEDKGHHILRYYGITIVIDFIYVHSCLYLFFSLY